MKRIDKYVKRRHEIAKYYDNELKNLSLATPWQSSSNYSSYHLYTILIKKNLTQKTQRQIYNNNY